MPVDLSIFQKYSLSPMDELSGSILGSVQLSVLHNLRTDIAQQKLNLVFTPNDVLGYTQQEAYLSGQLDLVTNIIDKSEAATIQVHNPQSRS